LGKPADIGGVRLSTDEKSLAIALRTRVSSDLWAMNLATGALSRMMGQADLSIIMGPWSPDSSHIAVNRVSGQGVVDLTVASAKTSPLLPAGFYAFDWSPDGRQLLCSYERGSRLAILPLPPSGQPQTIDDQPYHRTDFRISPDGRYVAFTSDESKRSQITVAAFPSFAEKRQVSVEGGSSPQWRKDGKEIIFAAPDNTAMSVEIRAGARIEAGVPRPLFKLPEASPIFAVTGDGRRILVAEPVQQSGTAEYIAVVNWTAEMK
jgi:Tol biopolymer transport system component